MNTVNINTIIGIIIIIAGVLIGLYVGVWLCYINGIIDIIQQIRAPEFSTLAVVWGVTKILFAGLFGWIPAMILIRYGAYFIMKR